MQSELVEEETRPLNTTTRGPRCDGKFAKKNRPAEGGHYPRALAVFKGARPV